MVPFFWRIKPALAKKLVITAWFETRKEFYAVKNTRAILIRLILHCPGSIKRTSRTNIRLVYFCRINFSDSCLLLPESSCPTKEYKIDIGKNTMQWSIQEWYWFGSSQDEDEDEPIQYHTCLLLQRLQYMSKQRYSILGKGWPNSSL